MFVRSLHFMPKLSVIRSLCYSDVIHVSKCSLPQDYKLFISGNVFTLHDRTVFYSISLIQKSCSVYVHSDIEVACISLNCLDCLRIADSGKTEIISGILDVQLTLVIM